MKPPYVFGVLFVFYICISQKINSYIDLKKISITGLDTKPSLGDSHRWPGDVGFLFPGKVSGHLSFSFFETIVTGMVRMWFGVRCSTTPTKGSKPKEHCRRCVVAQWSSALTCSMSLWRCMASLKARVLTSRKLLTCSMSLWRLGKETVARQRFAYLVFFARHEEPEIPKGMRRE